MAAVASVRRLAPWRQPEEIMRRDSPLIYASATEEQEEEVLGKGWDIRADRCKTSLPNMRRPGEDK